jgi:hypothetical protein
MWRTTRLHGVKSQKINEFTMAGHSLSSGLTQQRTLPNPQAHGLCPMLWNTL